MFKYYKVNLRLIRPQLGTQTKASIHSEHVLEKAKKEIAKANMLSGKLKKSLDKYRGVEISESKEIQELQGILRGYMELVGSKREVPDTVDELIKVSLELEEDILTATGEDAPTIFQRSESGTVIIGSHMVLGNLKENAKIIVNSGDKSFVKSKVAVGEMGALDIKCVSDFLEPTFGGKALNKSLNVSDIIAKTTVAQGKVLPPAGEGSLPILERPIKFDRMGKTVTAIARSEMIPAGCEYELILRVREGSPLAEQENLEKLLDCGKNNGLGQARGSLNMGAYIYKIEEIKYDEKLPQGWK